MLIFDTIEHANNWVDEVQAGFCCVLIATATHEAIPFPMTTVELARQARILMTERRGPRNIVDILHVAA